jgi:hypothetical protein
MKRWLLRRIGPRMAEYNREWAEKALSRGDVQAAAEFMQLALVWERWSQA